MKQANKKKKKGSRVIVGIKNVAEKFCALCKKFFFFFSQTYDLWFHSFRDIESLVIWTYLVIFTSLAHQGLDFAGYLNNNVFWCSEIVLGIWAGHSQAYTACQRRNYHAVLCGCRVELRAQRISCLKGQAGLIMRFISNLDIN